LPAAAAAAAAAATLVAYLCLVRHFVANLLGDGVALILACLLALHVHVHVTTLACKQQQKPQHVSCLSSCHRRHGHN
jgi:hypothetical protein